MMMCTICGNAPARWCSGCLTEALRAQRAQWHANLGAGFALAGLAETLCDSLRDNEHTYLATRQRLARLDGGEGAT